MAVVVAAVAAAEAAVVMVAVETVDKHCPLVLLAAMSMLVWHALVECSSWLKRDKSFDVYHERLWLEKMIRGKLRTYTFSTHTQEETNW